MEGEGLEDDSSKAIKSLESKDDTSELKSKFDEQQQMIGQLEAISKAHEKGMEDYTLRLAKMKPRLRGRGRGRIRTATGPRIPSHTDDLSVTYPVKIGEPSESNWPVETIDLPQSEPSQVATEESDHDSSFTASPVFTSVDVPKLDSSRSKALLLRKQLEENRIKFDKQQKENVDKRIAMEEMRDRVEGLRIEVENRDQLIESLQRGGTSAAEPDSRILYQQILHKDNTILDLTEKVSQLELHIQDQREQLDEKEQVIVARTEAVGLVAKDRDQKLQTTVDQLEHATVSAHKLQKLYDSDASLWQDTQKSLNETISEKDAKICTFEENVKRTEAIRFQLNARNAEVQDKLVAVQTEMQVVNSKLKLAEKKVLEKSDEISELNKKVNRSEAFGQKKLKTFEKYFKSVEEEDLGERILMLSNNIALLEEEKGNLQLKLVDCDEINSINERLSSENIHLEAKCDNLHLELLSVSATVSFLEKEKITLIDSLNDINLQKNHLNEQLSAGCHELEDVKQKLAAFDVSFSSLEKERDLALNKLEIYEANDRSSELNSSIIIQEKDNLQQLLRDRDSELCELRTANNKLQTEHSRQTEIANVAVQNELRKREDGESLLKLLTNKEEFIRLQATELGDMQEVVNDLEANLTKIHQKDRDYEATIRTLQDHVSQSDHSLAQLRREVTYLHKETSDSEKRILSLQHHINELNREIEDKIQIANRLQSEIESFAGEVESAKHTIASNVQELQQRSSKISELMEGLRVLDVKYKDACSECDAIRDEFVSYEDTTKKAAAELKSELNIVSALISDKDNQIATLRSDIEIKEDQIKNSDITVSKFEQNNCDNNRKIEDLLNSTSRLETELNMMVAMISDKDNQVATLRSDIELKEDQIKNNDIMISKFEQDNCDKNRKIDDVLNSHSCLETEVNMMSAMISDKDNQVATLRSDIEIKEHQIKNNDIMISKFEQDNCDKNRKMDDLLNSTSCLEAEVNMLSSMISVKDNQIATLKSDIEIKEDQIMNSDIMVSKFELDNCDKNRKIDDLLNTTSRLEAELNRISVINVDNDHTIAALNSEIETKRRQIDDNQTMISDFEVDNCTRTVEIDKLGEQRLVYESETKAMRDSIVEYESSIQIHLKEIKDLNNLILERDSSVMSLKADIESSSVLSAKLNTELDESRQSYLSLRKINDELNTQMESINIKNHDTLSQLETTILNYENEIVLLRQDIGDKQLQISYMENQIELSQKQLTVIQQALISNSSEQLTTLQQDNYDLGSKFSDLVTKLDEKLREVTSLRDNLDERTIEYAAAISKLTESHDHIDFLTSNFADNISNSENLTMEKETVEYGRNELLHRIDNLNMKLDISTKNLSKELFSLKSQDPSNIVTEVAPAQESMHVNLDANQASLLQGECDQLAQEKLKLERDLLEAQQAIVRLETSLATQSAQEEDNNDGCNEWGDVDLGKKNQLEPSLQTTLMEKDRVLTMTQEQLKHALEQVNTVVDEKKLTEQQMRVLEAELHHKQEKIDVHSEEIKRLENSVQNLEGRCIAMTDTSVASDEQAQTNTDPAEGGLFSQEPLAESAHIQSSMVYQSQASDVISEFYESADITTPMTDPTSADLGESSSSTFSLEDQYKLKWYEDMWPQWTNTYNQMCSQYQTAEEQVTALQSQLNDAHAQLREVSDIAKAEMRSCDDHLKECQDSQDLQKDLIVLQNQIGPLEGDVMELKSECNRLRLFETLCSERQTIIQELEARRDGTNARILELELMVQAAESEISIRRSDMQRLTTAGNSLETERSCLKEEITNLTEEIRKDNAERGRLSEENTKLQHQAAATLSSTTQLEEANHRTCCENAQLRSELEVLEGDAERTRTSLEFLEVECNRLRAENEIIVQNGQVLEAEKESLAHELQRISNQIGVIVSERDHLEGEGQRLSELSTSAESEIARLKIHLESMNDLTSRYQRLENQYTDLQSKLSESEDANSSRRSLAVEEIDWSAEGSLEKEHFQSSDQSEEIGLLNEKIRQLEKKKNSLDDELYAAKLKNGKMIQKLKASNTKVENLQKELEKCKQAGLSDLDAAVEAAWKEQIDAAEAERDEYKIRADELEKEKCSFVSQIDVLQSAQEKYLEMKENQDSSLYQLSDRNKALESQASSMEWKIAELEEALRENAVEGAQPGIGAWQEDNTFYINRIAILEKEIEELSSEKMHTNSEMERIKIKTKEADSACDKMRLILSDMREAKDKLEKDCQQYKKTYFELHSEHETLIDTEKKSSDRVTSLDRELNALKYSYDSIYTEYNNLQLDRDTVKYDLGIMAGEKAKLQEELISLNNIQEALKEEEQETIIIALQEECATQRQQNNDLKDEITHLTESSRQSEEDAERAKYTLEQQLDIQELVRNELNEKMMEVNYLNTSQESQEKDIKYERAEVAALKAKVAHLQQSLEQQLSSAMPKTSGEHRTSESEGSSQLQPSPNQSLMSPGSDFELTAHLSDLRCRQLSLEINKLLEERDALQLKLSSSLRQIQELSRELSLSQQLPTPPPSNTLKKKLAELRELNSSLEERTVMSSLNVFPPTMPTFVCRTAPPTPTASRQTDLRIIRDTQQASGLVGWILGRGPEKEVLHV